MKNQEASVKYQDILKENELLKDKLTSMGKEMDKIKSSVSMAFEEEEQTKVKIRELITAMHGQLQQAQQRILEKEEENLKLLMIIKQFKEGRSFEVGKTQSVGVPRIIRDSNSDSQQKVSNSYRNHISGGEDRDEEDENENEDDYNNVEMDEGDSAHIDNQMVPQRRSLQPERKKKSSNLKASHEEDIFSKPASQGPTKSAAGGIKKNPSKQKVDVLKSNLLQDQFQTYASQKSKDTKEKEGRKPPIITDKAEIANKFLSTIKRSKQKINKIESDQGIPQPPPQRRAKGSSVNQQNDESAKDVRQQKRSKSRKPKRDDEGKQNTGAGLSDNERHMMQAKVDMISQMNAVLSEFELRIHQMKSDMSNLIGK